MDIDADSLKEYGENLIKSRTFLVAVALFIAAFAVRWMFAQHGFWIDEGRALLTAENFLNGQGFRFSHDQIMMKHPFIFYTLIAFSYLIFGVNATAGMVTSNVLASLTVVLVFLIGKELFNEYAGAAAGILMLFNPLHMFYSTRILTDAPVTFFVALTIYFLVRSEQRNEEWSFYATFIAAGMTILTKLTGIVLLPTLFIYYLYKDREKLFTKRKYWIVLGIVVGLYAIWEIRNFFVTGQIGIIDVATTKFIESGSPRRGHQWWFYLVQMPNILGLPGLILLLVGAAFTYIYKEGRMKIPMIFLAVTYLVFTIKSNRLNRYIMPIVPIAMVVSGYGVDRIRNIAASWNDRGSHVLMAAILIVSAFVMFQSGAAMIGSSSQGFTGLDEAGTWIKQNTDENAKILAASSHQIRFFSDRWTAHAGGFENPEELEAYILENDIDYVEVDRWEQTQPEWYPRYVQESEAFAPVKVIEQQGQAIIVVYKVNNSFLG